jgi:arylamine N-acetyltransferase
VPALGVRGPKHTQRNKRTEEVQKQPSPHGRTLPHAPADRVCYAPGSLQLFETSVTPVSAAWVDSYLKLLGLEREAPGLEYLRKLNRAHVLRVPFENITSILRRAAAGDAPVPALDRDAALQAWTERRGGGVCFEVVDMLGALLSALGFRTHSVLATISFAGSHQANLVELDGERYMVDAGNGAPFFEPIPVSRPLVISRAGLSYRFRPVEDGSDRVVQDRLIEGEWKPFCTYDLGPGSEAGRADAFQRHHLRGGSWVVDNLTVVRSTETDVWSLRDDRLTHFSEADGKSIVSISSPDQLRQVVAETFGLPAAPLLAALAALDPDA